MPPVPDDDSAGPRAHFTLPGCSEKRTLCAFLTLSSVLLLPEDSAFQCTGHFPSCGKQSFSTEHKEVIPLILQMKSGGLESGERTS